MSSKNFKFKNIQEHKKTTYAALFVFLCLIGLIAFDKVKFGDISSIVMMIVSALLGAYGKADEKET